MVPTPLNLLHASGPALKIFMAPIVALSRARVPADKPFLASLGAKASMASFTVFSQILAPLSNSLYIWASWAA